MTPPPPQKPHGVHDSIDSKRVAREILLGFWKVHILHHAAEHPVVGQWMLNELRRHGYEVSPGTLYPLLKRMERNGWLRSETDAGAGPRSPRYYHLTAHGKDVLETVRGMMGDLRVVARKPAPAPAPAAPEPRPTRRTRR